MLPDYLATLEVPFDLRQDTYSVVARVIPGRAICGLCSAPATAAHFCWGMRIAVALGARDIVETLLLNMFHGCKISAMPRSCSAMTASMWWSASAYVAEQDLIDYAALDNSKIVRAILAARNETLHAR